MSWKQKAYDKLLNDGWTQGTPANDSGECCAGGAIAWAITGNPRDMYSDSSYRYDEVRPALEEFAESVGATKGCWCGRDDCGADADVQVLVWNDRLNRTEEEVLEAFRKLAEAEEPDEEPEDPEVFAYRHGYAP